MYYNYRLDCFCIRASYMILTCISINQQVVYVIALCRYMYYLLIQRICAQVTITLRAEH